MGSAKMHSGLIVACLAALLSPAHAALSPPVGPGVTYSDPATGLIWTPLAEDANRLFEAKIPEMYNLGYRPATAKEFDAVDKTQLPGFTGYVYAGNDQFVAGTAPSGGMCVCVCACVLMCVRACVRVCV